MNEEPEFQSDCYPVPNGASRSPKRICITVPYGTYQRLLDRSDKEGRSLSNLAGFLLESAVDAHSEGKDHFI